MIVRAAVVPHPPLLVPELVAGAAAETAPIRAACVTAARRLAEMSPHWVAIAPRTEPGVPGDEPVTLEGLSGTFAGFGVDVPVALREGSQGGPRDGPVPVPVPMPLPALVAAWLRAAAAARSVRVEMLPAAPTGAVCRELAGRVAREARRHGSLALLVLGDGSARVGERAPWRADPRSERFEADLSRSLEGPEPAALRGTDAALAAELGATGWGPWQVLASVFGGADGARPRSEVLYSGAPYGVGYHVAVWDGVVP